jgi:hypothetical protein
VQYKSTKHGLVDTGTTKVANDNANKNKNDFAKRIPEHATNEICSGRLTVPLFYGNAHTLPSYALFDYPVWRY